MKVKIKFKYVSGLCLRDIEVSGSLEEICEKLSKDGYFCKKTRMPYVLNSFADFASFEISETTRGRDVSWYSTGKKRTGYCNEQKVDAVKKILEAIRKGFESNPEGFQKKLKIERR